MCDTMNGLEKDKHIYKPPKPKNKRAPKPKNRFINANETPIIANILHNFNIEFLKSYMHKSILALEKLFEALGLGL